MPSFIPGYNYDIFISYRQKDNKGDMWVSEFVEALKTELESTFKEEISVYFDINPHDGLLETHDVDESLKDKLRCLVFIPIISRTYCDPKSFAWEHEFKAFVEQSSKDQYGLKVKLPNGNVASRILPIQIHDLDKEDISMCESIIGSVLRGIEFIYKEPGVNKPLADDDDEKKNLNGTKYKIQINKVSNAIKEVITAIKHYSPQKEEMPYEIIKPMPTSSKKQITGLIVGSFIALAVIILGILFVPKLFSSSEEIEKSIAVLPFKNDSPNQERMYFINGTMEAILDNLCKIKDLRVPGRTSVEQYRDNLKPIPTIAKELDVNYILEGSGHRDGNKVRLYVQLLDARKDKHLWSKTYDADIEDIFSMQSEIAKLVAEEIEAIITPEEQKLIDKIPTTNLTAYDLHLQAQDFYNKYVFTGDRSYLDKVSQLAYISLELDPEFALAYYWIGASSLSDKYLYGYARPFYLDTALFFFNKSLELDPTLADAYSYRGIYYFEKGQKQKSIDDLEKAISLSPNNSFGYLWLGFTYVQYRDYINALINLRKAEKLERSNDNLAMIYGYYWWLYISIGDMQKAEPCRNKYQQLVQSYLITQMDYWMLEIQGKWEELLAMAEKNNTTDVYALIALRRIQEAKDNIRADSILLESDLNNSHRIGIIFWMIGKKDEAMKYFNRQIEFSNESIRNKDPYGLGDAAYDLAGVYAVLGNREKAYKWLREYEKLGFLHGIHEYIKVDLLFDNLRNDDEFKEIVKRANDKADEIRARINEMEEQGEL
jgi:TolB-like protein/lipoprotein NlpI